MVLIGHGLLVSIGMRPYSTWGVLCYLHRGVQLPFDSSGSRPLGSGRQQGFPLFRVLWIYEWVGRPAFSCLGRGLVEMALLPFQAVLVSATRDRASSDLGGNNLPVFEIPISWFPDLAFHSMPTPSPSPTKGSMGLILSSDAGGYFLPSIPSNLIRQHL